MRIRKLTLAGFGPYKNEQVVDFDRFESDGIFLITGKTGAGKSSILDAICFALYSGVPRYDGTQSQLRSDHCEPDDPTFVELEFGVAGADYRLRRVPEYERPKKRGTGVARQAHEATLAVRVGDSWQVIAAKPVHVADEIARIVSLTRDQFLQVVLLAQNRFQQFLLARNDERQAVLRTLFGSKRFERIETALDERRKQLQASLASADEIFAHHVAQLTRLLEAEQRDALGPGSAGPGMGGSPPADRAAAWLDGAVAGLSERSAAAALTAAQSDLTFGAADMELRTLLDTRTLQQRRSAATMVLDGLSSNETTVARARSTVQAARRAAPVWPLIGALESATAALDAALAAEAAARLDCGPYGDAAVPDLTVLDRTVDELTTQLGALAEVLAEERLLPALESEIARQAAKLRLTETALAEAGELGEPLPAQLEEITARITAASVLAGLSGAAREAVSRLTAARDAATAALESEALRNLALAAEKHASSAHTAAAVRLDALLERRLSGHAAELAAALVDGEPCAVCGSTAHPAPATSDEPPVSEGDVDAARESVAARRREMDAAHGAVQEVSTRLTEARTRAEGRSVNEIELELLSAARQLRRALDAANDVARLETERDAVRSAIEQVARTLEALRETRQTTAALLAETEGRRAGILARTERQRGQSASVTERVDGIRAHLESARALQGAIAATSARRAARDLAAATLAGEIAEQGFDDADAAAAARRGAAEIAETEALIRRHDELMATARATLDEPGIAGVPMQPVEIGPAQQLRDTALERRDRDLAEAASLADRLDQANAIVSAAKEHQEATGRRRAEFDQLRQLASVVRGDEPNTRRMRLETFVLAAQLEEIVAAANSRLRTMSAGRYALEHDDALQYRRASSGLGLAIRDEHTGRTRPTHSLSGGETFLASLALALGLAEVVTNQAGGITLDTLFVDEGFGSLDSATLDIAMSTLDGLRTGGRTIGLISHVEAMNEQIPAKLRITVSPRGHSSIDDGYDRSRPAELDETSSQKPAAISG